MKHSLRKFIASSTAALTIFSAISLGCGTSELIRPVIASAGGTVSSGQIGIEYIASPEVTLYFYPDMENHHFEVWGSKLTGDNVDVTIPDTVTYNDEEFTVTAIRPHAFYNQTNLGVIHGSSEHITSIGQGAFYGCSNLKNMSITNRGGYSSVEYIGPSAFEGCSSLTDFGFALYTDEIGAHAFWDCTSLYNIYLYDIKTLGNAAFYNCSGVDTIEISQSPLTYIPNHAFAYCSGAKEIHLPETISEIGIHSFADCDSLETVYIPDSVSTLGTGAFLSCDSLRTVMMSEEIISVGDHAFFNCPNMKFFVCKNPNAFLSSYCVGWHLLDNGMPVTNDDFVLWSTGSGRVKNYAINNGLDYRNTSEAPALASARYKDFEWANSNTLSAWAKNGKYYFNSAHTPYANGKLNKSWDGICGGMAIVSALTSSGYLSVSDYAPQYSKLRSITANGNGMPSFVKSYVTTVWANQNPFACNYSTDFTTNNFGKEMLRYAEYITYGADAAVFSINGDCSLPGHAMVCFGLEFKNDASDKNDAVWNGWDARLMIYDVNRTSHKKDDYFYVNLSDGSWYGKRFLYYGYDPSSNQIEMTHSYSKMVAANVDDFFNAIKY
ncbi:MAG: leucine-rich repeat domain-containing protein [Ruminococcus sp.]|uniref:leucine-rich repeat domain-containing protein n=1 Tax=Ruminococcus sp. TaxID=41978 RepID=UPI0025FAD12B|nr:leucine-rich repeat domain-containing protein [Ruminococcus sp.]MCR4796024.1 leucine-rich repeat domain-containing protein [Ruminococcus sp.]